MALLHNMFGFQCQKWQFYCEQCHFGLEKLCLYWFFLSFFNSSVFKSFVVLLRTDYDINLCFGTQLKLILAYFWLTKSFLFVVNFPLTTHFLRDFSCLFKLFFNYCSNIYVSRFYLRDCMYHKIPRRLILCSFLFQDHI